MSDSEYCELHLSGNHPFLIFFLIWEGIQIELQKSSSLGEKNGNQNNPLGLTKTVCCENND